MLPVGFKLEWYECNVPKLSCGYIYMQPYFSKLLTLSVRVNGILRLLPALDGLLVFEPALAPAS